MAESGKYDTRFERYSDARRHATMVRDLKRRLLSISASVLVFAASACGEPPCANQIIRFIATGGVELPTEEVQPTLQSRDCQLEGVDGNEAFCIQPLYCTLDECLSGLAELKMELERVGVEGFGFCRPYTID